VGIVGAAGRGESYVGAFRSAGANVVALCDVSLDRVQERARTLDARAFDDYDQMLDAGGLDAVVIGTPMQLHAPQVVAALERGIHVMSEVTAAVTVDECRAITLAARRSRGLYMLAENYCYFETNMLVRELVRAGELGDLYYAEGEYLHDVRDYATKTPWRRHWQMGIDGITYGTHSLGPILQWMPGDRVVRVCCEASTSHHDAADGSPFHRDAPVMLCKTARGALIKIRVDLCSPRPHAIHYHAQGTHGVFESSRGGPDRLWLASRSSVPSWTTLDELRADRSFVDRHWPRAWLDHGEKARAAGHGGGDFLQVLDFVRAARGEIANPIDVDAAMDMTLPGLVSQQSIARGGTWIDVPDSRAWQ
jgi:predicted dehydrogenase